MDDYLGSENDRLLRSHREIDDMLGQGSSLMSNFKTQGDFLKNIRTKNLDIRNTLGMSNTIMRLIEKRVSGDRIILFGGMIAFTVFMLLVWKFLL